MKLSWSCKRDWCQIRFWYCFPYLLSVWLYLSCILGIPLQGLFFCFSQQSPLYRWDELLIPKGKIMRGYRSCIWLPSGVRGHICSAGQHEHLLVSVPVIIGRVLFRCSASKNYIIFSTSSLVLQSPVCVQLRISCGKRSVQHKTYVIVSFFCSRTH